jgi:hypothetical protein
LAVALLGSVARADEDARALFQKANAHFAVGEFERAAELYEDAYKLKQDPALLFNAAQALRLAGKSERALTLYRNYVMFYPQQKNIPLVKQQIQNLQRAIASVDNARTAPPTGTEPPTASRELRASEPKPATQPPSSPKPASPKVESAPPAPPPVTATAPEPATTTPPPAQPTTPTTTTVSKTATSDHQPVYKKWWLWTAVAGGVVVVTGVALAVAFTTSSGTWQTAPAFGPGVHATSLTVSW